MRRRWLGAVAALIILVIIGAGLWLAGTGSNAQQEATPTVAQVVTPNPTMPPVPSIATSSAINATPAASPSPTAVPTPRPVPTLGIAQAKSAPAKPVRLVIPKLGINAAVVSVGLAANGDMAAPSTWETVGWYNRGPLPGEAGNAVIDGHLDSYTGPAVFWHLRELKPGDSIQLKAADGATLRFVVTGSQSFDVNSFPSRQIFGPASVPQLNLITCNGSWDQNQGQYNQRLVVFTKLVGSG